MIADIEKVFTALDATEQERKMITIINRLVDDVNHISLVQSHIASRLLAVEKQNKSILKSLQYINNALSNRMEQK